MKTCTKCGKEKALDQFSQKKSGRIASCCKSCKNEYNKTWYQKNREAQISRTNKNRDKYYERNRQFIRQLKSQPCTDCGKKFHFAAMHFDHLRDKKFNISDGSSRAMNLDKLKKEIAKCEVVCANCHAVRTYTRLCSSVDRASAS